MVGSFEMVIHISRVGLTCKTKGWEGGVKKIRIQWGSDHRKHLKTGLKESDIQMVGPFEI